MTVRPLPHRDRPGCGGSLGAACRSPCLGEVQCRPARLRGESLSAAIGFCPLTASCSRSVAGVGRYEGDQELTEFLWRGPHNAPVPGIGRAFPRALCALPSAGRNTAHTTPLSRALPAGRPSQDRAVASRQFRTGPHGRTALVAFGLAPRVLRFDRSNATHHQPRVLRDGCVPNQRTLTRRFIEHVRRTRSPTSGRTSDMTRIVVTRVVTSTLEPRPGSTAVRSAADCRFGAR